MRLVRAKKGDVRGIYICYKKSLENVNGSVYNKKSMDFLISSFYEEDFLKLIEEKKVYCIKKSGSIAAFVIISENKIDGLYVYPAFTGRGYGEKLLKFAEKRIRKKGYSNAKIYSTLNSEKFYLSQDYLFIDIVVADFSELIQFIAMEKQI